MAKMDPSSLLGEERLFLINNIRRIAPATAAAKMATTAPAMVAVPEPLEVSEVAAADSAGPRIVGVVEASFVVAEEDAVDDDVLLSDEVDKGTADGVAVLAWDVVEAVTPVVAVVVIEVELEAVAAIVAGAVVVVAIVVCTVAVVGAGVVVVLSIVAGVVVVVSAIVAGAVVVPAMVVGVVVACSVVVSGVIVVISVGAVDV